MGSEIQKECQDCCNFEENQETEAKNERSVILKSAKKINGGEFEKESLAENNLTFIDNNVYIATQIITNPKFYQKMIKGERIHQILEPLTSFLNKNLFEIVNKLLFKITELYKGSSPKNNVYVLFEKTYKDLINRKIIENLSNSNMGYFTKIKFNLLFAIEIIAELYHYFNYHFSNEREPYNINYWEYIKNPVSYMKDKILDLQKILENISNFIVNNRLQNLNHSINIHINTSKFDIQMEQ
jgi:hypothetical protein